MAKWGRKTVVHLRISWFGEIVRAVIWMTVGFLVGHFVLILMALSAVNE